MDDFGNSIALHWDAKGYSCCRAWVIFHFYGIIGPGGCLNVACNHYADLKLPYNHH